MAKATCSVDDCQRPSVARGWCQRHYKRWHRHGDPLADGRRATVPLVERMWRHIRRDDNGCWVWTGSCRSNGYGVVAESAGHSVSTHRAMYELLVAPIPEGLHLDHLCRNRACCAPHHLEPVTPLENVRRGRGHGHKTHCPQGHPYEGHNLRMHKGRRYCRTCGIERARAWRQNKAA